MSLALAALSALLFGAADFTGGVASRRNPVPAVLVLSQTLGFLGILAAAPLIGPNDPSMQDLLQGAAAGLSGAIGLSALYRGLAKTLVAVVSPAAALVGAAIPVLFGLLSGEQPGPLGWIGIAVALPAILLLTWEPSEAGEAGDASRRRVRSALLYGMTAGTGFGFFFVLISLPAPAAGLWPLVAARVASVLAIFLFALLTGRSLRVGAEGRWAAPLAGILDMAANVAFILALRGGLLVLTAVITSLYPAPTVLLARVFFRERLGLVRWAGLVLAVAGVALMSAG